MKPKLSEVRHLLRQTHSQLDGLSVKWKKRPRLLRYTDWYWEGEVVVVAKGWNAKRFRVRANNLRINLTGV